MGYVLVVNGMKQILFYFLKYPYYNIMAMSTFLGLTMSEGQKEEINMVNW